MKKKTFLTALILFCMILFGCLLVLSTALFQGQVKSLKEKGLSEHYIITTMLAEDIQAFQSRGSTAQDAITYLYPVYQKNYKNQNIIFDVMKDGKSSVAQAMSADIKFEFTGELEAEERKTRVIKSQKDYYVEVLGKVPYIEEGYHIRYLYQITDVIENWRGILQIMGITGMAGAVIFAAFFSALLNRVFHPLHMVTKASERIASGEYSSTILYQGHDEISNMAENFNEMGEKIRQQMIELEDEARRKQQFVDNFSHELRTPLTAIYGYAEYLQKVSVDEEERQESVACIMDETKHILNVAEHLLELSCLRNQEIEIEKINVEQFFEHVKHSVQYLFDKKQLKLNVCVEQDFLYGNKDLLKRIIVNLTNNAAEACDKNGIITWSVYQENNQCILAVTDNGKGMPRDVLERIKEPFYRADKSRNREKGGAGLGLSICEQIAQKHHARLKIFSELDKGTEIKIIFTS